MRVPSSSSRPRGRSKSDRRLVRRLDGLSSAVFVVVFVDASSSSFALVATLSMSTFFVLCAPVLVGVVEPADRALLDRTLAGRGRSPCAAACACSSAARRGRSSGCAPPPGAPPGISGRGVNPPGRGGRWTRAEAARAAGPRTAEAARPRARPAGRVFARPRLADRERPSFERLLVEPPDRLFSDGAIRVVDEREAARTAGFPIDGQDDLRWVRRRSTGAPATLPRSRRKAGCR